jgi:hypothetical protein
MTCRDPPGQDNFVSHTMKAEEEKRMKLIADYKSKAEVPPRTLPTFPPPMSAKQVGACDEVGSRPWGFVSHPLKSAPVAPGVY